MIERDISSILLDAARQFPAVTLTGPRQSGKTTLCRALFAKLPYVNLEFPDVRASAESDPRGFLDRFSDGAVIDEVQHFPDLLSYIQPLIDLDPRPGRWIITGSHNVSLLESVRQSLAGRTAVHELLPLTRNEILRFGGPPLNLSESILTGGYPRVFDQSIEPTDWYRSYVSTYLERDVGAIRSIADLSEFRRFVQMCAGRTAQLLNFSSLANDVGISQPTAKAWFGLLEIAYIAFAVPAYHANIRKRLVKMPKLHFVDTGLLCFLLGIRTVDQLRAHPLIGSLFETWVASEICKHRTNDAAVAGVWHYRDRSGAEADLIVEDPDRLALVECKSAATLPKKSVGGVKRVAGHLSSLSTPLESNIVYGGLDASRIRDVGVSSWTRLRRISLGKRANAVTVTFDDSPAPEINVYAFFPNSTFKSAITDDKGLAHLRLHDSEQLMTVYVAAEGFESKVVHDWIPSERPLTVRLDRLSRGGSSVFELGTGHIPGISGRLNPILDTLGRTYLYADNISIGNGAPQPTPFEIGDPIQLADADGNCAEVRIVGMIGRAALVEYRQK